MSETTKQHTHPTRTRKRGTRGRSDRPSRRRYLERQGAREHTPSRSAPPAPPARKISVDPSGGYESVFASVLRGNLDDGLTPALAYSRAAVSTFRFATGLTPDAAEGLRTRLAAEVFEERAVTPMRGGVRPDQVGAIPADLGDPDRLSIPRGEALEDRHPRNLGKR